MLTRLRIKGFKNLKDVDLRFGLFNCIAGPNGVGKSNLFDAIMFLSDLASMPIIDAASKARGTNGRASDFSTLFYRHAEGRVATIEFVVEMIVPSEVRDDFDRVGTPKASLLEYSLTLKLSAHGIDPSLRDPILIEREELRAKSSSEMRKSFESSLSPAWAKKFIFGPGARNSPFIETVADDPTGDPKIKLWGDGGGVRGRAPAFPARKTPQTVLAGVNSVSHPTVLAARREMQSWRLLQLEPSALRRPDNFGDDPHISSIGEHMPGTLMRLQSNEEVALNLSELLPGVVSVEVDADEKRQAKTLIVAMKDKNKYSAGSLSDGTLRFLALSILATDPDATGLLCMEEPENGIHPLRVPEMLRLVRSLSDEAAVQDDDPGDRVAIRQIIINTHSPLVVAELPEDTLLMAEPVKQKKSTFVDFRAVGGTWRTKGDVQAKPMAEIAKGQLLTYLRGDLWSFIRGQSPTMTSSGRVSIKEKLANDFGTTSLFPDS